MKLFYDKIGWKKAFLNTRGKICMLVHLSMIMKLCKCVHVNISDTTVLTLLSRTAYKSLGSSFSFSSCNAMKVTNEDCSLYYFSIRKKNYYYRPQTKFAKVMFLHVSIILSTGRGCLGPHPGGNWGVWLGEGVSRPTPMGGGEVEGYGQGGV